MDLQQFVTHTHTHFTESSDEDDDGDDPETSKMIFYRLAVSHFMLSIFLPSLAFVVILSYARSFIITTRCHTLSLPSGA
jgi:hypothetical protein